MQTEPALQSAVGQVEARPAVSSAAPDATKPDPLTRGFRAYLEAITALADAAAPPWLGGRRPTQLFIWPAVVADAYYYNNQPDIASDPWVKLWQGRLRAWHQERNRPILLLEGTPGHGKSAFLRMLARALALEALGRTPNADRTLGPEERAPIPLLLPLPVLARADSLPQAIEREVRALLHSASNTRESDEAVSELVALLHAGRLCLLLDALDEVTAAGSLAARLHEAAALGNLLLVTSRPGCERSLPNLPSIERLVLAPWGFDRRQWFLTAWGLPEEHAALLASGAPLHAVAENPLLLTLTCAVLDRAVPSQLPGRAAVYTALFEQVLEGGWQAEHGPVMADWESVLPEAAWRLFEAGPQRNEFSRFELLAALSVATGDEEGELNARLEALLERGVLMPRADGTLAFAHRSFLEHFVARHWQRQVETCSEEERAAFWEALDRRSGDPAWQEPILHLAALTSGMAPLLHRLTDPKHDDLARHRLALAARCLGESPALAGGGNSFSELATIRDHVTEEYFRLWLRHERNGTRRFLPETGVLPALARAGGRPEGHTFLELAALLLQDSGTASTATSLTEGLVGMPNVEGLSAALADAIRSNQEMRWIAAHSILLRIGPSAATPEVVAALCDELSCSVPKRPTMAAVVLRKSGPAAATPEVLACLEALLIDEDDSRQRLGVLALRALNTGPVRVPPAILADLRGEDPLLRTRAIRALTHFETDAIGPDVLDAVARQPLNSHEEEQAIADWFRSLGSTFNFDPNTTHRPRLAREPPRSPVDWSALSSTLRCWLGAAESHRRWLGLTLLAGLGETAWGRVAAEELLPHLADAEPSIRIAAVRAAQDTRLGSRSPLIERLRQLQSDPDPEVATIAIECGPPADRRSVEPRITALLDMAEPGAQRRGLALAVALFVRPRGSKRRFGPSSRLARRIEVLLETGEHELAHQVSEIIASCGWVGFGPRAVSALISRLKVARCWDETVAGAPLADLPVRLCSPEVIDAVVALSRHDLSLVRRWATAALITWGRRRVPELASILMDRLAEPDPDLREATADWFTRLPAAQRPWVRALALELAQDPRPTARCGAALLLAPELKPPARALRPLVTLLDDPEPEVRGTAAWLLRRHHALGIRLPLTWAQSAA
jgi:HEAT repeat protein